MNMGHDSERIPHPKKRVCTVRFGTRNGIWDVIHHSGVSYTKYTTESTNVQQKFYQKQWFTLPFKQHRRCYMLKYVTIILARALGALGTVPLLGNASWYIAVNEVPG